MSGAAKISCPMCGQPLDRGSVEEVLIEFSTLNICGRCGFGLDLRWRGRGSALSQPTPNIVIVSLDQGLTPKPVDGYLDLMEKHWGETDLTKVNEDLQKTLGNRYDPAFKQNLTAAVYTGDRINKGKNACFNISWNMDNLNNLSCLYSSWH